MFIGRRNELSSKSDFTQACLDAANQLGNATLVTFQEMYQ
jgi:hypothetical protein